eukprot:3794093-Ditylum_brightwellii.AAC.1
MKFENIEEDVNEDRTSDSDDISDDNNLQEMNLERVQQDQDEEEYKSDEEDNDETNEEEKEKVVEIISSTKVWYFKLQKWIDHVRDASAALIWILETYVSLDKMIMRFCSHSLKTRQMKNKPIEE